MLSKRELHQQHIQMLKELSRHLKSEKYRTQVPNKAFISWFIFARFGDISPMIIDGGKDGGIDAIAEKDNEILIFQMKYEDRPRISNVTRNEVAAFEKIVRLFKDFIPEEFSKWLQTVRPELKDRYNRIKEKILSGQANVRFVFVTSKKCTYPSSLVEISDIDDVLALWDLFNTDLTPPTESIQLELKNAWNIQSSDGEFITYVGLADVKDFRRIMRNDKNDRLFARNVRTFLTTDVNKHIKESYEKEPEKFWLGNNGIYIVCKKVIAEGSVFTLAYPSVINGSQTLHSISQSSKDHSCKLLVRILQMDVTADQKLLAKVIRRTNTQNTMKMINLLAHDPFQINIARFLNQFKIFYERREKEWKNEKKDFLTDFLCVNIKDITQWLASTHSDIGLGTIRSNFGGLLQESEYPRLFDSFDFSFKSLEYNNLVCSVWSGLFFKNLLRHAPKDKRSSFQIAQHLFIKMLNEATQKNYNLIRKRLNLHAVGKKIPKKIVTLFVEIMNDIRRIQKQQEKKNIKMDFTNFFKNNDQTSRAYKMACQKRVKALSVLLEKNIEQIT